MDRLTERIIERILSLSNSQKENVGNILVEMFGGDYTKQVTNLRKRRGNADGGIDGRIDIVIDVEYSINKMNGKKKSIIETRKEEKCVKAAFNVKLTKADFNRTLLHGFKEDMIREKIYTGVIIANKLSPDARDELNRYNSEETCGEAIDIYFISLEELIENKIECPIKLKSGKSFQDNINLFLSKN